MIAVDMAEEDGEGHWSIGNWSKVVDCDTVN